MINSYTVSELTLYIRQLFDFDYRMQDVWVSGEISNFTKASSGHWYFTLKDSSAQIKCVVWRSSAEKQTTIPRNGDALLAHGKISVYEPQGIYQLYADQIRPAGVGDLYQQFEMLKAQLEAEGLFDPERKRLLPVFPRQIGVVTSPEAAAFQDVQNVLRRRFPLAEVILSPTIVQGAEAPPLIVAALERLNAYTDVDVILVCRGGGSIEDLWAFNDERVARAIASSSIPVITGVGHETDFTIADFAADLRAPTPSAAAEMMTPDIEDLRAKADRLERELRAALGDHISDLQGMLMEKRWALKQLSPISQIQNLRQRIDDWNTRMIMQQQGRMTLLRERLNARDAALRSADPRAILAKGYAMVYRADDGRVVKAAGETAPGLDIQLYFQDGVVDAKIKGES